MFLFILLTIFVLANLVHSGLVYPDTSRPIDPFRNNVPASSSLTVLSDYTFKFRVQTPSSSYPIIRIKFPEVYTTLNSGDSYVCTFQQSSTTITENCLVEAYNVVRFPLLTQSSTSFQQITGGSASITIQSIQNPQVAGGTGTGMFAVSTYSQANVIIDTNDDFGSIGLSPSYTDFPAASISNDGAPIAGYLTNYILQFQNAKTIPQGSWFRLQFPSGYGFGTTVCSFLSPSMDITCSNQSSYLYMTNLSQALSPGTYRVRLRNIQNPYSKGSQTGFRFESMKQGTNTVMEQSTAINSITITAGAINSPSIAATNLNRNLRVDYTISFTPSNTIPQGGSITIIFPSTYGALDSVCRIIRGLTASSSGLLCVADSTSKTVTISGFTETPPQFIQIKIYATNPNNIGLTPQFYIASFRNYPPTSTSMIDENANAGQVSIADVDNPYVVEIDVYKAMTNTSLNGVAPLDFRVYPQTALPATPSTSSSTYGKVWLQIPLWWRGSSTNYRYRCNFGPTDSGDPTGCYYGNQIFKMYTPVTSGLTQCDLPISLDYVRVTLIPGRWDFRVHTFINSSQPEEQDLWTMDIPADPLASASGLSTSLDTGDNDAVLRVNFYTVVTVPISGAINFNMSTIEDVYENTAAWDPTLGLNFSSGNFTQISCRIAIGGTVVGYSGAPSHQQANCVAYLGNTTSPAIIQIRGFSQAMGNGTLISIDIPNIKICSNVTMMCVFELTTAYTTTLDNPYTLNYYTVNVGTIIGPNNPILGTTAAAPIFSPTMICLSADYTFTFTPQANLASNDHILIKFPANKFTFKRDSITSPSGSVAVIYVSETDEIFFLVKLTISIACCTSQTLILSNITNSNGEINTAPRVSDFSGVVTSMIYWHSGKEIEHITFGVTNSWADGGIYNENVTYYPIANTPWLRSLDLNDWIPFSISFTVCHIVNYDGGIKIDLTPSDYQNVSSTCQARSGLIGQTTTNGFTSLLSCTYNSGSYYITGFQDVPQFSTITIGFSLQSQTTSTNPQPYQIRTYYDSAFTNVNDYLLSLPASSITGPLTFPNSLGFVDWLSAPKLARVNKLGTFNLTVNMSQGLPAWTSSVNPYIDFTLDSSMGIYPGSGLDCRHNGSISYHCQQVGNLVIRMATNQYQGIPAGSRITVTITTLGAYQSSNTEDGIVFNQPGRFTITAEAYQNGGLTESSQLEFEVFGSDFLKYWVYSFNKGNGGLTMIRIYATLNPLDAFPSSEDPIAKGKIVLEFSRTLTTGFASDLGTGIVDKGAIPCNSKGLPILPAYNDIQCILLVGLYNNPTRIEISGFDATNQTNYSSFQIEIPKIYNPNSGSNLDIPDVVTRIYSVVVATGVETELFYHNYDLINVTYPQSPATTSVTVSTAPTLSLNTVSDQTSTLTIVINPTVTLQPSDHIVIELPLFWKASRIISCNVAGNTNCNGNPDANWIVVDIDTNQVPPGTIATFVIDNPPALLPSSAQIKAYYFFIFKLWNIASYPALGTTLIPLPIINANVTSPTSNYGIESGFIFSFIVPQGIPQGGAIRIYIPSAYAINDLSCENDGIGGSTLGDQGFQCSIDASTRQLIAYGFPALAADSLVVLNARLTNPSTAVSIDPFEIETHYIYASPLETQIAVGNVTAPPIVAPTTTVLLWGDQYHQQDYLYAGDIGPLRFRVSLATALSTTDVLIIEMPTAFDLAPDGQPVATWNSTYALTTTWSSTTNPKTLMISSTNGTSVVLGTNFTLEITSMNADNGINGFVLPTTPGTYQFTFKTSPDGTTIREQQTINVPIYAVKFTTFYSTTEIINYNMKTSIRIQFVPTTTIPIGGKLILYIPTRNSNGVFLFNNDLRSGIADGGSIPCHDVSSSFGLEPTCTLQYGNRQLGTPVQIIVTGWTSSLNAGNTYSFRVNKVMNPVETGDDRHVVMRLESYSTSAATSILNAGLHYDFTIQKFDPTVVNAPSAPTTNPKNAGQSGATFQLSLYSNLALRSGALFDSFIIEFPPLIPQPLGLKCNVVSDTNCVSLPGNNWVFYSNAVVSATTYLATTILNAQQVIGIINSTSSVLNSYAIRNRIAITQVIYPAIDYSTLTLQNISATITVPSISGSIPYRAPLQFLLTFTVPAGSVNVVVPASGAITFTLPTSMTAIDSFCVNDVSSQVTGSYGCTRTGQVFTMTGFDQINAGSTVAITFWAQINTASTVTTFDVSLYQDAATTVKIAANPSVTGPTSSANLGFQKLYTTDTQAFNFFAVKASEVAPFNFYVTPNSASMTNVIVTFPAGVTVPSGSSLVCGWGSYEAKSCVSTYTTYLTVTIETPHTPALTVGTTYKVFITSYGGSVSTKGLLFSNAGTFYAQTTIGSSSVNIPYEVYAPDFTSLILTPFWSNANQNNYLAVLMQAPSLIPTAGKIVLRFPQQTQEGVALFASDLGTGLSSGSSFYCTSETTSTFTPIADQITCTIKYGAGYFTYIEITGFNDVTAGNTIEFFLGSFKNPNVPDTGHVYITVHTEDGSGNIINQRLIRDVFTPQTISLTPTTSTYTRTAGQNQVQTSGVTYTFSSLAISKAITTRSSIILMFPSTFTLSRTAITVSVTAGGNSASTSFKTYANFMRITPIVDFPSGSVTITLNGTTNPYAYDSSATSAPIRILFVYYRSYETDITTSNAVALTTGSIAVSSFSYSGQAASVETEFSFTLSIGMKIPAGGVLQLSFPSFQGFNSANGGVIISGAKSPVTVTIVSTTSIYLQFGRSYDPTDGDIVLKVLAKTPSSLNIYTITINAYFDTTLTKLIATGTQTYQVTMAAMTAAQITSLVPAYATTSQTTTFEVNYVLNSGTSTTDANEIHINIGSFTSIASPTCQVNSATPTYCGYSNGLLVIGGFTLNANPSTNTISFDLVTPSTIGNARLDILTAQVTRTGSLGSSITTASSVTYLDTASVGAAIYTNAFNSVTLNTAHKSVGFSNFIEVSLTLGSTDVSSPVFYVELPDFATNLALDSSLQNSVPCMSPSVATLTCTLESAVAPYLRQRVRIQGFSTLAASSSVTFRLFRIGSPTSAVTANIYLKLASMTIGNYENNVYGSSFSVTFSSVSPTSDSQSLTLSDYSVRNSISYDLTIASPATLANGDLVFYELPYFSYGNLSPSASCSISCTLYPQGGVLVNYISSLTSFSLNPVTMSNPPGVPPITTTITGYVVQSDSVIQVITYTPSTTWAQDAISGISLTALQANTGTGYAKYSLVFTLTNAIPQNGILRIQLPLTTAFTANPTATSIQYGSGILTGSLKIATTISNPNVYFDISGFTAMGPGAMELYLQINQGKTSGSFAGTLTSYMNSQPTFPIESGGFTLVYSSTVATFNAFNYVPFVLRSANAFTNGNGIWSFAFMQSATTGALSTSNVIRVIPPLSLPFSTSSPIRCKFRNLVTEISYLAQECFRDSLNNYQIIPPTSNTLAVGEWQVTIFTVESDLRGLPYPTSNGNNIFTINIENSGGTVIETNIIKFRVFNSLTNTGFADSYLNNINQDNLVRFTVTLASAVSSTGKINVEFPMLNASATLNSNSLYTAAIFRGNINSTLKRNGSPLTGTCKLLPGSLHNQKPTIVSLENLGSALSAGDVLDILLSIVNGPTTIIWTNARLVTADSSGNNLDFYTFDYLTYTSNPTSTSDTLAFPSPLSTYQVQSLMNFNLNVNPSTSVNLAATDTRLSFGYNQDCYGGSTQGVGSSNTMEFWSTSLTYITLASSPGNTPQTFSFNNFKNPMSVAPFTSSFYVNIIKKKVIVSQLTYTTSVPTFTQGSFASTSVAMVSNLKNDVTSYTITFTLQEDIPINGNLQLTFPTGYTLQPNTCSLKNAAATNCTISGLNLNFNVLTAAVTTGTQLIIYVTATNPSSAGTTGSFTLSSVDASNYGIATATISGVTILSTPAFNFLQLLNIKTKPILVQALENAPLRFNITLSATLAQGIINYIDFTFPTTISVTPPTTTLGTDLVCRWNSLAASGCDIITNGFRVYTPVENDLTSGSNYTVFITTNRYPIYGFSHPVAGSYAVGAKDINNNSQIKQFVALTQAFASAFIVTRITTINRYTIVYMSFSTKQSVLPQTDPNHAQIIVELPTMLSTGETLFPVDLGKGIQNGDSVDCVSNVNFKCRLSKGGVSASAPSSIIMEPQVMINANYQVQVSFAWVQIGSIEKVFTPLRVYFRDYSSSSNTWTIREELLKQDTFYTTSSYVDTSQVNLAAPTFNLNTVGYPASVSFSFDYNYSTGSLRPNTYDRIVILSQTTNISVQASGVSCSIASVQTHQISQWFEVTPTSIISPTTSSSPNFTISFTSWNNVPYVVAGGVQWQVYVWQGTNLRQIITYSNTADAIPHAFSSSSVTAYNSKIRAVSTYEFLFLPYNKIPYRGSIYISIPSTYIAINPECQISGLVSSSCIIQDDGDPATNDPKSITLSGFNDYDPAVDGAIKLQVTLTNPSAGGYTGYFTLSTNWTGGQLIDQNLNLFNMYIDPTATFYEFYMNSLQQFQTQTCAGSPGPMKIQFSLKNSISYPNGFITITMDPSFNYPYSREEVLCYFTFADIYNLKSHRCDWSGKQIDVYATEEKGIPANTPITLTITTRGSDQKYQDGIRVPATPGQYFVRVDTSTNLERAYPIANIPACPFNNFLAESAVWHNNLTTLLNFYLTNTVYLPTSNNGGRLVVEIPTHNEIASTFLEDLGREIPAANNSAPIGCGSACATCPFFINTTSMTSYGNPLQPDPTTSQSNINCTLMKAPGRNWGDRAIVFTTNLQDIAVGTRFNFQVARITNPDATGWPMWTHVRIRTQMKAADGTYVDLNDHWAYFIVPNFTPTPSPSTITGNNVYVEQTYVYFQGNYSFNHPSTTNLVYGDYVIYEFTPTDIQLENGIHCDQNFNVTTFQVVPCAAFSDSLWISAQLEQNYPTFDLIFFDNTMRIPYYVVQGGITVKAYEVHNHQITRIINFPPYQNVANNIQVVMQTPSNTNDVSLTLKYQIGVFVATNLPNIQYFRLQMPGNFSNPNNCVVRRGLILKDVNNPYYPVQCVITPNSPGYLIEVFNFTWGKDGWFILDMILTNPATPGFTDVWNATSYDNYNGTSTNLTRIMDSRTNIDGRTWIGALPFPNLFRVYRNTLSFEDRRAKEGEYGEIDMRLVTKRDIPAGTGNLQIWLPDSYNIPNGGEAVCSIGNSYHTDLDSSSCTITSDRKIYMTTNSATGIPSGTCSLISATTINSANGNNGFQTPLVPGSYQFQVFIYNGSNLQEYSNPSSSVLPTQLTALTVRVVHRETSQLSVVRVTFTTPSTIPAGYDTAANVLDVFSKPPIGSITVDFNTDDDIGGAIGWPLDLGFGSITNVPCKVISGLTIRTGYTNIKCTLIPSASANPKNPARVVLSNFEQIVQGTANIEVHLLNIQNPPAYYNYGSLNKGYIYVGAFETYGDNSTANIIEPTTYIQAPIQYNYVAPQTYDFAGTAFFTPNTVGSVLIVAFPWDVSYSTSPYTMLSAGDVLKLMLPSPQFSIPDDGSISAVIDGVQLITYVYNDPSVNEIHFEIPTGKSINFTAAVNTTQTKYLSVSQLRNMAYADSNLYTVKIWIIQNAIKTTDIQYANITPATASNFNSLSLVLSSYFSGDVYVTYSFGFVPSYNIPQGSTFTITLPSPQYDYLFSSQPPMICSLISSTYLTGCSYSSSPPTLIFTALVDIPESTALSLQLTGVKNPTYVGVLPQGSISMSVTNPTGFLINQGSFSDLTFVAAKSPGKISLTIDATNFYKSVDADYTFSLQNSNNLPIGGNIILDFASDWAGFYTGFTISTLTSSFTSQTLFYTVSTANGNTRLIIVTQFTWPAKTSIYVSLKDMKNPTISQTQVFRASTTYDGVILDQTDPLDTSTYLTFETPPPLINVVNSSIYPTNEGELATYNLTLSPATDLPAGSTLQLLFPSSFGPLLTTVDATIQCSSPEMPSLSCTVSNGKLIVTIPNDVPAGTSFNLVITGITNPNEGDNGAISLLTTNGATTLQFASQAIQVNTTAAPQAFDLTLLTTSSTNLQALATYTFCAQTDQPIPQNAQIFINFPQQFTLRQSSYQCSIPSGNNSLIYPSGVTCTIQNNIRRFIMTGQSNYLNDNTLKSLCYQIDGVENPADSGETNSFSMEVYDINTLQVLYRSFGTLSYPTTLSYSRVGLRIIVSAIDDFVKGLMSDYISVQLERSVSYQVVLEPKTPGFTFVPPQIYFRPDLSAIQKFRIVPDVTTSAGSYFIQWNKTENSTSTRFAEVPDSYFNYVATAAFNKYRVILGTTVSRTALLGTSLPISIKLTQSPATNLNIYYNTSKPSQSEYVEFNPPYLTFQPGELEKTFQYTTITGAVSGLIQFTLQTEFQSIYYMETDILNFEILDIDTEPPEVLNEYIVTLDRTYMYYRISTTESVWVYYLLTLKGTVAPPIDEIKNATLRVERGTKTDVVEITGKNSSYQADITSTYIYYDVYLSFTGLEEQTDYVLYYVVEDLSGNSLKTRSIQFQTFKKHQPAMFNMLLTDNVDTDDLEAAFSLVTGMETSRWQIVQAPQKFTIPNNDDTLVQALLDAGTVTYSIMLLQNITADEDRPIDIVSLLETNKYLLIEEISQVVSDYDINKYSYEVLQFDNEMPYQPLVVEVDEDYGTFNMSLKRNGTMFGVVLIKGSTKPSARQIKYGLNASNFLVPTENYISVTFEYASTLPYGAILQKVASFTNLFDNTEYEAHFIGQNDLPINPDVMSDDEIVTVSFLTQRELFIIPNDYQFSSRLSIPKLLVALIMTLALFL